MLKQLALLVLILFYSFSLLAQSAFEAINDSITKMMYSNDYLNDTTPGLAVGVIKDGEIVYEKYIGHANLNHMVKIDENTRFNIASTAKQFTALMILKLKQEEKLDLEDDIRKYLPSLYPNVVEKIKIRHLINHTSGVRDYVELMSLKNEVWWKQMGLDNNDIMELLEKQEDLGFKPGSRHSYSNSGYIILTKIIEKVMGENFNDYSKAFFEELGMNNTAFVERYMGVIPHRADPYSDWGRGEWWVVPTVTKTNGEGFLFTTLKDQLHFELAIQNANKDNNALLIESQLPIRNSNITKYGFGLKLEDRLDRAAIHHDGVTYSYHSQMIRFPEENLSIFIMSNNGNISSERIANSIAALYLPKAVSEINYNDQYYEKSGLTKIENVLGNYNYPDKETIVRIEVEDEKTYWKDGNNFSLEMLKEGPSSYSFTYDPNLKVVFYENEMVEYYPSGKTKIYKRNKEPQATISEMEELVGTYYSNELDLSFELNISEDAQLTIHFTKEKNTDDVKVVNRSHLLTSDYTILLNRDVFDRVTEVSLTYGRAVNICFKKKTNLVFQPKIDLGDESIQVTTIGSIDGDASDILLTKNDAQGNEIWSKQFGGRSFDKASSVLAANDGYLIVGSTSSYGKGNYDIFVIKTDKNGVKQWQNTYGDFYNEYGYSAQETKDGYLIKGTTQYCTSNTDVFNRRCDTNVWFVSIDKKGREVSNEVLEEVIEPPKQQ